MLSRRLGTPEARARPRRPLDEYITMRKVEKSSGEGIGRDDVDAGGVGRTIHQRKHSIYDLSGSPTLEETDLIRVERKGRKLHRCCEVASEDGSRTCEKGHTGSSRKQNGEVCSEDKLYRGHQRKAGGDPPIVPRDSIDPRYAMRYLRAAIQSSNEP